MKAWRSLGFVVLGTGGTAAPRCSAIVATHALVFAMRGRSMARFAKDLQLWVGRQVVDKTGIRELFDVELQFQPDGMPAPPGAPADVPTLYMAVREQLGLRLKAARGPVRTVVIDAVERPTPD
jgi:uncharacterized protein (TIGR03435 family)